MGISSNNSNIAKILADQPVARQEDDLFEYTKYANSLIQTITNTETPITFGVFGKWGSGKTSLMRMLYDGIQNHSKERNMFPVWFEAWRYENEDNLIIPLLYTIRDEIRRVDPKRLSKNYVENLFQTLDRLTKALAHGIEVSTKIGETTFSYKAKESLNAANELAKEYDKSKRLKDAGKSPYYDLFFYLREQIRDLNPLKIIIFVDDLDRCHPEKAIAILESVKLTMNIEGIMFVIAAEREILERITENGKYGGPSLVDGNSFLRKIFQVVFNLPPPTDEAVEKYVNTLMEKSGNLIDIAPEDNIKIIRVFSKGSSSNPREIKRLINNFSILYSLASNKSKPGAIAFMLAIQQRWPTVFQNIITNRDAFIEFCSWVTETIDKTKVKTVADDWHVYVSNLPADMQKNMLAIGIELSVFEFILNTQPDLSFTRDELDEYIHFSAIGSMAMIHPDDLRFTHIATPTAGKKKNWTVRAEAPDAVLNRIEQITFALPAAKYPQHQRTVSIQDGFSISDIGSTNETIRIKVLMKNGSILPYTYYLNLS